MAKERVVVFQTLNEHKSREMREAMAPYGVTVVQDLTANGGIDGYVGDDLPRIKELLTGGEQEREMLGVMREWTNLFKQEGDVEPIRDFRDLDAVVNVTRLQVWELVDGKLVRKDFKAAVPGYVDMGRTSSDMRTFDWDDRFVPAGSQATYAEMRARGLKRSSRDIALGEWIRTHHLGENRDLDRPNHLHRSHFPELVFDGSSDGFSRRVYILHQMVIEALRYLDLSSNATAQKDELFPQVRGFLRGQDADTPSVAHAVASYEEVSANFDALARNASNIKAWRSSVDALEEGLGELIDSQTLSRFIEKLRAKSSSPVETLDHDQLIALIFEEVFAQWQSAQSFPQDRVLARDFLQYMSKQLYIFDVYDFVSEGQIYRQKIVEFLLSNKDTLDLEKIARIKGFYDQFVDILASRKLIDTEECAVYKRRFPMPAGNSISNDDSGLHNRDIRKTSNLILGKGEQRIGAKPILGRYKVGDFAFQQASDLHWDLNGKFGFSRSEAIEDLAERIIHEQREGVLFLLGDLFYGEEGRRQPKDTSEAINELLDRIHAYFEKIFFVPGNHDLRRSPKKDNPWADFILPRNVVMPIGADPIEATIGNKRLLIGNLFYDMNFVDPDLLGLSQEEVAQYYSQTTDGQGLLLGKDSIGFFSEMSENMARKITPDVDMVATHVAPHPCVVRFKAERLSPELSRIATANRLDIQCSPLDDERQASFFGQTPAEVRRRWNCKSLFMGSNLLRPEYGARPRPGITMLYGHNHRGAEILSKIDGIPVRLLTHQRPEWDVRGNF